MHRRSSQVAVLLVVVGSLFVTPAAGADTYDEQYALAYPSNPDPRLVASYGMYAEAIPQSKMTPMLLAFEADGTKRGASLIKDVGLCTSMDDQRCKDAEYIQYDALLPYCSTTVPLDCIAGLSATDATGTPLKVTVLDRFVVPGADYTGSAALRLPVGHEGVLFTIEGVTHPGGNLFMGYADLSGDKIPSEPTFQLTSFRARIAAVKLEQRPGRPSIAATSMPSYEAAAIGRRSADGGVDNCVLRTYEVCAAAYPMPMDVSLGMTLRLATQLTGWLHGRFSEPTSSVGVTGGVQTVSLQAKPVKVPSAVGWIQKSETPADLASFYAEQQFVGGLGLGCTRSDGQCSGPSTWLSVQRSLFPDSNSMREFTMWLKYLGDRAVAVPSAWLVQNTAWGMDRSECYQDSDKLSGIVMTNATSYIAGPPSFNKQTQTLDYKVAAPHFLPDGKTAFQGTYDLQVRSDVARCIYGFSNAPISASVSVISDAGENQVATTVVNEKDGWLTLRAAGFTFSSPTIRVKLSQETAQTRPLAVKKIAITCVKGKSVKKTTASKCPAGYRKK